jgi:hypothetical protein
VPEGSPWSDPQVNTMDSSLWRIRVCVRGGSLGSELVAVVVKVVVVLVVRVFAAH